MTTTPWATPDDVADIWRPLSSTDNAKVVRLIAKASARLQQKCPFDIQARVDLFATAPTDPTSISPDVLKDVVAEIVKRVLVNPESLASTSHATGPFSESKTFISRYDKSGDDARGTLEITEGDIDQLRPAVPANSPFSFHVGMGTPSILIPAGQSYGGHAAPNVPIVIPDVYPGTGVE